MCKWISRRQKNDKWKVNLFEINVSYYRKKEKKNIEILYLI